MIIDELAREVEVFFEFFFNKQSFSFDVFGLKAPWICVFTFKLLPIYLPISYAYNDILMIIF